MWQHIARLILPTEADIDTDMEMAEIIEGTLEDTTKSHCHEDREDSPDKFFDASDKPEEEREDLTKQRLQMKSTKEGETSGFQRQVLMNHSSHTTG